jgi:catechol 2,3-dioxygenase-like lactoylglutathione lyase family enzyme
MKRFHVHVGVKDIEKSVQFYSTLFGQKPTKLKEDYAKWMLEDPRVNFAISTRVGEKGVDHLGLQVDEDSELAEITERLEQADLSIYDEGEGTCCYAESKKAWVQDPSGMAWEAYRTMGDAELFHAKSEESNEEVSSCCDASDESEAKCCG